jgi:hypothetical protein
MIQFLLPGPLSKLTSPFLMQASVPPGPNGVVRIELLGEDGRLLMREVKRYDTPPGARVTLGAEITFEITAAAETGRLQISVEDDHDQVMALASVDLILLSLGPPDANPAGDQLEEIVIKEPSANALIQGGTVRVAGLARPRSPLPLRIELKSAEGKIVGSRQVSVEPTTGGDHGSFVVDVPYTVESPTRVRLSVWEIGERPPGVVHLSSLEVMISP